MADFTVQDAISASDSLGVDIGAEHISPEVLAAGMTAEANRHSTKDAATNVVHDNPVIAAQLAINNLRAAPNYYDPQRGVTAWERSLTRGAKRQGLKTEYKTMLFDVEDYDEEQGIFSGYGSVFGNVDDGGDVVEPGAFTKTIAECADRVKILALHNDSWLPVGKPLELREDARGLFLRGKISDTSMGRDIKVLLRDRVLNELSIGYDPIVFDYDDQGIRHLREVKLWEVSIVTWAMNPAAKITDYKAVETAERAEAIVADAKRELKEGRKISGARLKALRDALDSMKTAASALDALIAEAADNEGKSRQGLESGKESKGAGQAKPMIEIIF